MRHAWVGRVGMVTLISVMALSPGLLLLADSALADKDDKDDKGKGSATNLSGVTQNWDKNLPSGSRFTVLSALSSAAVRDNNTGLVWEQAIDLTNRVWAQALAVCANKNVGGTVGWRLPSVVELKSVQDPSLPSPSVNSVFTSTGILSFNNWWSATTSTVNAGDAWIVDINDGRVNGNSKTTGQGLAWCVRGPMNADAY